MKYILTENRIHDAVKRYLDIKYNFIVSVSFHEKAVWLASENRGHTETVITIIVDPYKILEGNTEGQFRQYNREIRRDIWNDLNSFFGFEFDKYGSDWGIEVYGIKLDSI